MLEYIALGILIFAAVTVFYGIIVVHDVPYEIAVHRNHPHQDAIHVAGWISLLFMGAIWPFLWIWATLYREDRGWGMIGGKTIGESSASIPERLAALEERVERLDPTSDLPNEANQAPQQDDKESA